MDEARAGKGAKRLGARISANGYSKSTKDVRIEDVLLALDLAEREIDPKGRLRGTAAS